MNKNNALFTVILSLILLIGGCAWFKSNAGTIQSAVAPVEACLINEIADGALSNPVQLVAGCAGATLQALYTLVSTLISAALPPSEAGVVHGEVSPYVSRLLKIRAETYDLLATSVSSR